MSKSADSADGHASLGLEGSHEMTVTLHVPEGEDPPRRCRQTSVDPPGTNIPHGPPLMSLKQSSIVRPEPGHQEVPAASRAVQRI